MAIPSRSGGGGVNEQVTLIVCCSPLSRTPPHAHLLITHHTTHHITGTQDLFEQDWFDLYECISAVLDESYATQRPDMSSPSRGGISAPSRTKYNGEGGTFSFRVYSKKVDPYGQQVVHMTGTHKRTIWFVPSLQEKFKPVDFEL